MRSRCRAPWRSTHAPYDRYKRYSFDFDSKNFKLDFTNGVLIYKSIKGARANPTSQDFMTRNPNVTIWDGVTEAPDETARGDWMKLVANAGLQWDKAILDYLVQGHHEIERKVDPFWNGVTLTMNRPRPPKPAKDAEGEEDDGAGRQVGRGGWAGWAGWRDGQDGRVEVVQAFRPCIRGVRDRCRRRDGRRSGLGSCGSGRQSPATIRLPETPCSHTGESWFGAAARFLSRMVPPMRTLSRAASLPLARPSGRSCVQRDALR